MSDLVKVSFALTPNERSGTIEVESLWAESLGNDRYRLRNVPIYVYGYSERDVVAASMQDDRLLVSGVLSRGGHSTFRLFLRKETTEPKFLEQWEPLSNLGCTFKRATRRCLGVDVPPEADVSEVWRALDHGEAEGHWSFEEGHCGHL